MYVTRTEELAILKSKLDQIQATLERIDATTSDTNRDVTILMIEQARMKQELLMHSAENARDAAAARVRQ